MKSTWYLKFCTFIHFPKGHYLVIYWILTTGGLYAQNLGLFWVSAPQRTLLPFFLVFFLSGHVDTDTNDWNNSPIGIGTLHVNTSMDKSVLMWPIQKQILFQTRGAVYANHDSARCTCPHLFWLCQGEISLTSALFEEFQLLLLPERIFFFFNHSWNTGTVITEKNDKSFAWRTSRRSILGGKRENCGKLDNSVHVKIIYTG